MNKIKLLLKYFSLKELMCIADFKNKFPKKTNEELYDILKEQNPELYNKIQSIKELSL